jgi:hypothetical protein
LGDVPSPPARPLSPEGGLRGHKSPPVGPEGPVHVPQHGRDRLVGGPEGLLGEDRPAAFGVLTGDRRRARGGGAGGHYGPSGPGG